MNYPLIFLIGFLTARRNELLVVLVIFVPFSDMTTFSFPPLVNLRARNKKESFRPVVQSVQLALLLHKMNKKQVHVLSCRGPKAFQRHFAVCIFNLKYDCSNITQLILCLYLCRILAICESFLKLFQFLGTYSFAIEDLILRFRQSLFLPSDICLPYGFGIENLNL